VCDIKICLTQGKSQLCKTNIPLWKVPTKEEEEASRAKEKEVRWLAGLQGRCQCPSGAVSVEGAH